MMRKKKTGLIKKKKASLKRKKKVRLKRKKKVSLKKKRRLNLKKKRVNLKRKLVNFYLYKHKKLSYHHMLPGSIWQRSIISKKNLYRNFSIKKINLKIRPFTKNIGIL